MRDVRALTDNISYAELRFVQSLMPYLCSTLNKKRRKVIVNIAEIARQNRHSQAIGNSAVRHLAIAGIVTYRARQSKGTTIYIESPTGVLQIKEYFESGELNV